MSVSTFNKHLTMEKMYCTTFYKYIYLFSVLGISVVLNFTILYSFNADFSICTQNDFQITGPNSISLMHLISIQRLIESQRDAWWSSHWIGWSGWMVHLFRLITLFTSDWVIGWSRSNDRPPSLVAIGDVNLPQLP